MPSKTDALEARILALEEANAALLSELAALRRAQEPPQPKPEPRYRDDRTLPGVGGKIDQAGNRVVPPADPSQTTVSAGFGFGSASGPAIKPLGNGRFRYPDGIIRNGAGEAVVLGSAAPETPIVSPRYAPNVESQIRTLDSLMDRAYPLHRSPPDDAA